MPYKDPEAARLNKRANYYKNRELRIAQSKARKTAYRVQNPLPAKEKVIVMHCIKCGSNRADTPFPVRGNTCKHCVSLANAEYREKNKERIAESKKRWKIANAAHVAAKDRAYADKFPEKRSLARKKWFAGNRSKMRSIQAKDSAARKRRVPAWLSIDDFWLIEQAYELAAARTKICGFQWHVDHVLPLQGRTVSGLHVPTNLQVIPWLDNLRKSNRVPNGK